MTAQALSVLAFVFSFGGVAAIAFGLAAMIVLQVVWCCRMNKCGLNAAASFALVVAILNAILAAVLALEEADESCNNDDDYSYRYDDDDDCNSSVQIWAILLFLSAGLWVAVSTLVFIFANTKRYETCREASEPADRANNSAKVPVATATPASKTESTKKETTETTVLPDGTRKSVTTTIHPDGSKTITETMESESA